MRLELHGGELASAERAAMISDAAIDAYFRDLREHPMPNRYTADLSDGFFLKLINVCEELEASPLDMIGVMQNESGVRAAAKNPHADANGLIQFMGDTLRGLGWLTGGDAFRKLSAEEQVPFVRRYFAPHRGKLWSTGALYCATFLPALLQHADDPNFVLCGKAGPLAWAYAPNIGFDHATPRKGTITVQDLSDAVARACTGARWNEVQDRMRQAMGLEPTPYDDVPDALDTLPEVA